jgi:hypothetical protein
MFVFLVPVGRNRYELYSEPPADDAAPRLTETDGFLRRWAHRAAVQWHELVARARRGSAGGRFARWRDRLVCRLAETIAEQRTLWALRKSPDVALHFPSTLSESDARERLRGILADARRFHLRWLVVDTILFVGTGVLAVVPGPNLFAYYFLFRVIGHLQSWRGARSGMDQVTWRLQSDDRLAELGTLADLPRDARARRVDAIAASLNLRRLTAFFDRVAVPSA